MLRMATAPLYAAVLAGFSVLAFTLARREVRERLQLRPLFWSAALLVFLFALGVRLGLTTTALLSSVTVVRCLAMACIAGAAYLAVEASRRHRMAELLLERAPVPVDEAIEELRLGRSNGLGLFSGRVDAQAPVTSPGGELCAFYEAHVRAGEARRGPLLGAERADAAVVEITGRHRVLSASLASAQVIAKVQPRRCEARGALAFAAEVELSEGAATSWERTVRLGEECVIAGQIQPFEGGGFILKGADRGGAMLIVGEAPASVGRRLQLRAWLIFGGAASLCALSAFLLSRFG